MPPPPQRMPSGKSYSSNNTLSNFADHRSGYRTSSSDDMENDNTSSSYNNGSRGYPTSEAHLTRSAEDEYAYNMAQYAQQQQQRQRQPSGPAPIQSPELVNPHHQYAAAYNNSNNDYQDTRTPMHDKMEYASPALSDLDTHYASSNTHPPSIMYGDKSVHAYGQSSSSDKALTARGKQQQQGSKQLAMGGAGAAGEGVSSIVRGYGTPHQIAYLSVVLLQTLATAAMIAIVWVKIRAGTPGELNWTRFSHLLNTYWLNLLPTYRLQLATMVSLLSSLVTTMKPL